MDYAHKDTSKTASPTAQFNAPEMSAELKAIRSEAQKAEIPVSDDETLCFLQTLLTALQPVKILELGTAVGASGAFMLQTLPNAVLTTIERNANFADLATSNFKKLGLSERVKLIEGDAGEVIDGLMGEYDFIFLDCAKVQYIKYLPRLKQLLKKGGILLADDVLLFGYVTGEEQTPKKRRMLVSHVKEYITASTNDRELKTTVLNIGNGMALSVKI